MSQLYLVRHGQASFGSNNYDQLSTLGYQQAEWLGQHFQNLGVIFDRVITGDMARQQQTAASILTGAGQNLTVDTDHGFNEFDFHTLAAVYCALTQIALPDTRDGGRAFFQMLRRAMLAWSRDELHVSDVQRHETAQQLETWTQFHDRVHQAMQAILAAEKDETILVVSSGGAMAMALSQVLACGVETMINLNMQTRNTGVHHLFYNRSGFQLAGFNALTHLQRPDRLSALSYT